MAAIDLIPFQNYAGLRGYTQEPRPSSRFLQNSSPSTSGFIFTNIGVVESSRSSPVNRHSFVRATPCGRPESPEKPKMIRFPPSPGDRPAAPATKPGHLLRLARHPRPYLRFEQNRRRSTCGFVFALFGMVRDRQLNVVDGPISWRALHPYAQKRRHGGGRCLRGGWG